MPYTPHPTPYTLHPTPFTLQPTPHTLHPTPYIPYTIHPKRFPNIYTLADLDARQKKVGEEEVGEEPVQKVLPCE